MLKNYLKIALRNIRRNFTYSFINIFGLAVGLASTIVIGSWVYQQWSYDRHFDHSDQIYRVGVNFMNIGDMAPGPERFTQTVRDFPEVKLATSLDHKGEQIIEVNNRQFEEQNAFYADSSFFDLFSYSFLEGNPETALNTPNSAVLSASIAQKYFQSGSALGKTLRVGEDKEEYTVTGVVNNDMGNSHMPAELWLYLEEEPRSNWTSANYYNYVLLEEGVTQAQFKERLDRLIENEIYPSLKLNQLYEEWIKTDAAYRFIVMPLTDIYLKSNLRFELTAGGNEENVRIFAFVAIFILLIAAVNFINITTARSSNRAKEVGVRKTLGTGRPALIVQFLMESILICVLALLIAVGLAELFLSAFEWSAGMELLESIYIGPEQFGSILLIVFLIGGLAGLYPAFYLSGFKPVSVLKGELSASDNKGFRNVLVIVQFVVSAALLISMGFIYEQLQFMQNKDLGLDTENVMIIQNADRLGNQQEAFVNLMTNQSGIEEVSVNSRIPTSNRVTVGTFKTTKMNDGLPIQIFFGDYNYLSVLGFQTKEGRNFSRERAADSMAVILNESAVRALELEDPVGTKLAAGEEEYRVIGVVNDFNFESLRNKIEPAAILLDRGGGRIAAKVSSSDISGLLNNIQNLWKSFQTEEPMNYYFLDESYARLVEKEKALSRAVFLFTLLAVIISCLGLYGLSSYMCERRTKEIGVRKVLGAKVADIVILLNKHFMKPVLVAILLAVPVSFILIKRWLDNFAYSIDINLWIFLVASLLVMGIALLTVSWQSVRTANINPVDSLRSE